MKRSLEFTLIMEARKHNKYPESIKFDGDVAWVKRGEQ